MSEIRVTFSPMTVEPQFLHEVAVAMVAAQLAVAQAVWSAQCQVMLAIVVAQRGFVGTVYRTATQPG